MIMLLKLIMTKLQTKILNSLKTNKLNMSKLGERNWYKYFIAVDELVWARNFHDGYLVHIYSDQYKSEHLATYSLTYDYIKKKDILQIDYEKNA